MTQIIAGFPGIGKSACFTGLGDKLVILDSESSSFSWIREKRPKGNKFRNPDFPQNYIDHIKSNIGKADFIFVSTHDVVRAALKEARINYELVYPSKDRKAEFVENYIMRGNDGAFLRLMVNKWDDFLNELEQENFPFQTELTKGYLMDYLKSV